jgi:hypothetical protein
MLVGSVACARDVVSSDWLSRRTTSINEAALSEIILFRSSCMRYEGKVPGVRA